MKPEQYIKEALRTESYDLEGISERLKEIRTIRLVHASEGMQTESAEFTDALKKYLFYGKEIDIENLHEELGDLLWYIAIVCDELNVTIEQLMSLNIKKLKARYPVKFTNEQALNRDLEQEHNILSSNGFK